MFDRPMKKSKPKSSKIDKFRETLSTKKEDRKIPVGIDADLLIDEMQIEKHLANAGTSFFEVDRLLTKICAEKKYTERTFDLYMRSRWGKSAKWAYKIMQDNRRVKTFSQSSVQNKQLSEKLNQNQAAALGKADPEKQAEILKDVAKEGKVTAKKISEKIAEKSESKKVDAEFRHIIKDANGEDVPEEIAKDFQLAEEESKKQINSAQAIKNFLSTDEALNVEARGLRETAKDLLAGLKTHLSKHVLCPKCKGKKCAVCSKRGFVSNHFATKGIGKK